VNPWSDGRYTGTGAVLEVVELGKTSAAGSVGRQDDCSGEDLRKGWIAVAKAVMQPTMDELVGCCTGYYHGGLSFASNATILSTSEPSLFERMSGEMK